MDGVDGKEGLDHGGEGEGMGSGRFYQDIHMTRNRSTVMNGHVKSFMLNSACRESDYLV